MQKKKCCSPLNGRKRTLCKFTNSCCCLSMMLRPFIWLENGIKTKCWEKKKVKITLEAKKKKFSTICRHYFKHVNFFHSCTRFSSLFFLVHSYHNMISSVVPQTFENIQSMICTANVNANSITIRFKLSFFRLSDCYQNRRQIPFSWHSILYSFFFVEFVFPT